MFLGFFTSDGGGSASKRSATAAEGLGLGPACGTGNRYGARRGLGGLGIGFTVGSVCSLDDFIVRLVLIVAAVDIAGTQARTTPASDLAGISFKEDPGIFKGLTGMAHWAVIPTQ